MISEITNKLESSMKSKNTILLINQLSSFNVNASWKMTNKETTESGFIAVNMTVNVN